MCYLACLAIGALILVDRAVTSWTSGLSREMTVQVRVVRDADITQEVEKARAIVPSAESSRELMATRWKQKIFSVEALRDWASKGERDKVLGAVPVVNVRTFPEAPVERSSQSTAARSGGLSVQVAQGHFSRR